MRYATLEWISEQMFPSPTGEGYGEYEERRLIAVPYAHGGVGRGIRYYDGFYRGIRHYDGCYAVEVFSRTRKIGVDGLATYKHSNTVRPLTDAEMEAISQMIAVYETAMEEAALAARGIRRSVLHQMQ